MCHGDFKQGSVSSSTGTQIAELYVGTWNLNFFMKNLSKEREFILNECGMEEIYLVQLMGCTCRLK